MKKHIQHIALATAMAVGAIGITGCSVARHQQTARAYVDDSVITAKIKSSFAEDKAVAATSISVETFNGEVQLSGFAKSQHEKSRAAELARQVKGVKSVKNSVEVRH